MDEAARRRCRARARVAELDRSWDNGRRRDHHRPASRTRDGGALWLGLCPGAFGRRRGSGPTGCRTDPWIAGFRGAAACGRSHHGRVPRRPHGRPRRPHRPVSLSRVGPFGLTLALVSQRVHLEPRDLGRRPGDPRRPPSPWRASHPARASFLAVRRAGPGGIPHRQQRGDHDALPAPPLPPACDPLAALPQDQLPVPRPRPVAALRLRRAPSARRARRRCGSSTYPSPIAPGSTCPRVCGPRPLAGRRLRFAVSTASGARPTSSCASTTTSAISSSSASPIAWSGGWSIASRAGGC